MSALVPLTVAVPLIGAAAVVAGGLFVPRWVPKLAAAGVAAAVAVLATILILRSGDRPLVYAFGGWRPRDGVVVGIEFFVDPLSASLAALAAALAAAALVFSWRYVEETS